MKKYSLLLIIGLLAGMLFHSCSPKNDIPSPLAGFSIEDVIVEYSDTEKKIDAPTTLKNVVGMAFEMPSGNIADWVTVSVSETLVTLRLQDNYTINDRRAKIVLVMKGQEQEYKNPEKTITFNLLQKKNTLFEDFEMADLTMCFQKADTLIDMGERTLKNVKGSVVDMQGGKVDWVTVEVQTNAVRLRLTENKDNVDRKAMIRLMTTTKSTAVDSQAIAQKAFLLTQLHNTVFDEVEIKDTVLKYDQTRLSFKVNSEMNNIKTSVTDKLTGKDVNWAKVVAQGDSVVITTQVLREPNDRTALVTLYYPNGSEINDQTVKKSFTLSQAHNPVLDNLKIADRVIESTQLADTLYVNRELKDVKCQLEDVMTSTAPQWLSATISEQKVIFKAKVNNGQDKREARVTLYYPNGNNSATSDNTLHLTFLLTQEGRKLLSIDKQKLEVSYEEQKVKLTVTSNVKYQITTPGSWVTCQMTPIDELTEELLLSFTENKTEEVREGALKLTSGSLEASVQLKQLTNPAIKVNYETLTFDKEGGSFNLMVTTLTPTYKITKKGSWIEVGKQQRQGLGQFYHTVNVKSFEGTGPLRKDTIVLSTGTQSARVIITQHKYFYLTESTKEVEVGSAFQLRYVNHTSNDVTWKSANTSLATVSSDGFVQTLKRGKVTITASIGAFEKVADYKDNCVVNIIDVTDKVGVVRGAGSYVNSGGYVTADCPVIITNNFSREITITGVKFTGNDGQFNSETTGDYRLNPGESRTFDMRTSMESVYKPKVVVSILDKGQQYTKTVDF